MKRIRAGQPALLASLCTPIPWFPHFAKKNGYDGIWLETEHHMWDNREIQSYLSRHQSCDIDCMVRPASRSESKTYRLLDSGATGVMIPHVESPEEAQTYVDSVKNQGILRFPSTQSTMDMSSNRNFFIMTGIAFPIRKRPRCPPSALIGCGSRIWETSTTADLKKPTPPKFFHGTGPWVKGNWSSKRKK